MLKKSVAPPGVDDYDNPETIRSKKYATGLQLLSESYAIKTGQTPKEVVWAKGRARLHHYEPEKDKKHPVPVLLVYALILRPYILDLVPGNSLVEFLLERGFDVYLLDWGVPEEEDKNLSFDNYVLDYLPEAVGQVLRTSNTEKLTLFGYCQGGTMAAMHAALSPEGPLKNLVLLATPIDFAPEDPGLFGLWTVLTSEKYFDPTLLFDPDPVVETLGNVPADLRGEFIHPSSLKRSTPSAALARLSGDSGNLHRKW